MSEKPMKLKADAGLRGWDAKAFAERDPSQTCFTCKYAAKLRMGPADIMGQVVCKFGPKHLTSLPQPGGMIGFAGNPAIQPGDWCHQWSASGECMDAANDTQTGAVIVG